MKTQTTTEMIPELFLDLPEHTRLWIYQASHELADEDRQEIEKKLDEFCSTWSSHGKPLKCDATVLYNTFIIIGIDEISQSASGCSIDNSVDFIKELQDEHNVNFFEHLIFAILHEGEVRLYDLDTFKEKFAAGEIDENTLIFNTQVKTKSEFARTWIIPLKKSWQYNIIKDD